MEKNNHLHCEYIYGQAFQVEKELEITNTIIIYPFSYLLQDLVRLCWGKTEEYSDCPAPYTQVLD